MVKNHCLELSPIRSLFPAIACEFALVPTGRALLSTIAISLYTAMSDDGAREAEAITFPACASGPGPFGLGAAFRERVAGGIATRSFKTGTRRA